MISLLNLGKLGWRLLRVGAAVYLGLLVLLALLQRTLIYFPSHAPEAELLAEAARKGVEPWRDSGGQIIGWKHAGRAQRNAANRLVVFHGNTGYALQRTHYIDGFERLGGRQLWEVCLFEYPGFGARPGAISERAITEAGARAIAELKAADPRPIFVLGESLGSGPACATARARSADIAGVLLITPYASLPEVAGFHYPWVPVRWLLRDRWDNAAALRGYHGRVGVLLAGEDEVIPVAQGQHLFEEAHEPKRRWVIAGASHNGLPFDPAESWWQETSDFLLDRVVER